MLIGIPTKFIHSFIWFLVVAFALFAYGQDSTPPRPVTRDTRASEILTKSVAALGGSSSIEGLAGWTINVSVTQPLFKNNYAVRWKLQGDEFRAELTTPKGTSVLTSGTGKAAIRTSTGTHNIAPHQTHAFVVPAAVYSYLYERLHNTVYSLEYVGLDGDEGSFMIRTTKMSTPLDRMVTAQTWYIDKNTWLPLKMVVRQPDRTVPAKSVELEIRLADYRAVANVLVPFSSVWYVGSSIYESDAVTSVKLNESFSASDFTTQREAAHDRP